MRRMRRREMRRNRNEFPRHLMQQGPRFYVRDSSVLPDHRGGIVIGLVVVRFPQAFQEGCGSSEVSWVRCEDGRLRNRHAPGGRRGRWADKASAWLPTETREAGFKEVMIVLKCFAGATPNNSQQRVRAAEF
jgi:hypothetical protein